MIPDHHTKTKLKFKSQKSENRKINGYAAGPKIELKYLICHKQGPSLENMYTSLLSAHNCTISSCEI